MPGDKTEKPTARKQKQARERGQIARSRDITSGIALLSALLTLSWTARSFPGDWGRLMERTLGAAAAGNLELAPLVSWSAVAVVALALPALAVAWMAAATGALSQGGFVFAPAALTPNFSRLNPASRIGQLASLPALSRFLRSIFPVIAMAWVAGSMLMRDRGLLLGSSRLNAGGVPRFIFNRGFELAWKSALMLVGWSAIDYLLERQHVAGELRMSRQEVIDDYKETEGNPAIKARIRRLRRQTARRAMLDAAKRATVVITNPTEFAIALEYQGVMAAPMVVAKGRNILARQIKEVARWQGIPMIENPPLAHALYRAAEVGQYIPPKLYAVVASILAAIYRAEQRARGNSTRQEANR
ncbi:MAG TPA: EscU/YscU/HrcU family type III secretion system export apparatus switch protein [Terracidiphilus sp.]|nr:EscU/YscU/HrcU family type III secretion system export apparatus switch protein [Terracidiphilus sp.]